MRPLAPEVADWRDALGELGLEVVRFGDDRGDATIIDVGVPEAPALLHDVWVHPDHRRRGVARGLVRQACAWADERGRTVHLVAAEELGTIPLAALVSFYVSFGFRVTEWMRPSDLGEQGARLARDLGGYDDPRPIMTRHPQVPAVSTETTPGRSTVHHDSRGQGGGTGERDG